MKFDLFVGIDYSGAQTPSSRLNALQVYAAYAGTAAEKWRSPAPSNNNHACNWTRAEIAAKLLQLAHQDKRFIAGLDHGFSFPKDYFRRYNLPNWPAFLEDFVQHWPTAGEHVYVDFVRDGNLGRRG